MDDLDGVVEFEAPVECEAPVEPAVEDDVPEIVFGKKKKKKKKPKPAEGADAQAANGAIADGGDEVPALDLGAKKKKKKKKNVGPSADDAANEDAAPAAAVSGSAFASLLEEEGGDGQDENVGDALAALEIDDVAPVPKKKKKKKKPAAPVDDVSMEDPTGGGDAADAPAVEEEAVVRKPLTAAEKKKAKKEREKAAKKKKAEEAAAAAAAEEEDIDQILASLDGPSKAASSAPADAVAAAPTPAAAEGNDIDDLLGELDAAPAKATGKKNKKKKKAAAKKDNLDSLLDEFDDGPAADASADGPNGSGPVDTPAVDSVDDLLADLGEGEGGAKMTAAQKKKAKKKKKAAAAKAEGDANASADAAAGPADEAKGKKGKKESAAVRRMREQIEKQTAAADAQRRAREAEEARIAEEERVKQEAENKKLEERARKKAAEKARKERKRAEGTLLSKAEKERRRKGEIYKAQLRAQGLIPNVVADGPAGGQTGGAGPSKTWRRKKNRQQSNAASSTPETSAQNTDAVVEPEKDKVVESAQEDKSVPEDLENVPDDWEKEEEQPAAKVDEKAKNGAGPAGNAADNQSEGDAGDASDESSSDESEDGYEAVQLAIERKNIANLKARTPDNLRSPIICILGHVDTGKTKILDRIRRTNVQDGEAGGITQQIGATYFPIEAVKKETVKLPESKDLLYNVPSLLIIDTPGHESFTNLRTRGSSLCDIAILVIDIMHGIEPQTRESINLLKIRKTPFIVALNKIDRMFDWNAQPNNCPTRESLAKQPKHTQQEFHERVQKAMTDLSHEGFNSALYWENDEVTKTVSIVPTSAITGEGIPDLLMLLLSLPQKLLTPRLMFNETIEATVLEVKVISGLGTTIDIVLTGGSIKEGATIMVVGLDGPIVTTIRALLTPHPMKEMRVKGQYVRHAEIRAAQGIKISAEGLDRAVAGTQLYVVSDPDNEYELQYAREEVMKDVDSILNQVDRSGVGVYVQASTLGSLEALLAFLESSEIPVSGINIGPVFKKDVKKASAMLERQKEYATILAFDVKVEGEAKELAEELGVRIMTADIIYHLFDQFMAFLDNVKKERREAANDDVVFPSILKILPQHIYNKKDPIVVGVDVSEGILRVGTPLVVQHGNEWLDIGRVASIEAGKKQVKVARKGESVCIKIQHHTTEHIMYGRHFDFQKTLFSKVSRRAIDLLKEMFRDDLEKEDWLTLIKLKQMFKIQ